jgi:hypothetical protein
MKNKRKAKTSKKAKTTKTPKMISRPHDRRSVCAKVNKFVDHLNDGVNTILEQDTNILKMILWINYYDCVFNSHTDPFLHKHFKELETNQDYRDKYKDSDDLFDYQLVPMVKGRIQDAMKDLINSGGAAKFKKVLLEQYKLFT